MNLNDLLTQIPMDQIAQQLGVSTEEATQATRAALPALVQGMQANAQDPGGAASLQEALQQHGQRLTPGGLDVENVDRADGEKIVGHVFGDAQPRVVQQLGGLGGLNSGLIGKLLPMLAPLVMGWLAGKLSGKGTDALATPSGGSGDPNGSGDSGGGGIGGWLSDILGGGPPDSSAAPEPASPADSPATPAPAGSGADPAPAPAPKEGGGWLSDILGGLLGQGRKG